MKSSEESVEALVRALRAIANSVTPLDATPVSVGDGHQVGSLTEAIMYLADSVREIAHAIDNHADAVLALKDEEA